MKKTKYLFLSSLILLFVISLSSCKDCLDCVGTDIVTVQYIQQQTNVDTAGNTFYTYPAFFDTTLTGRQIIIDFCDGDDGEKWQDYDGKETTVIESVGDSSGSGSLITVTRFGDPINGAQITTTVTKWQCN